MASAFEKLVELVHALNVEGVRYVIFGGQAVDLHGIPRITEDKDAVRPIDHADAADLKAKFGFEDE